MISGEEISEKGIRSVDELLKPIPGFSAQIGMYEGISARGLNPSIFTSSNPVTLYVGGVAQSNKNGSYLPLSNIERIEILRGPSSAIYGKDSIGGIINVVPKEPPNEWSGKVGMEYGSKNSVLGRVEMGGALKKDVLFLGLNGSMMREDGWIVNELDGSKVNYKKNANLGVNLVAIPTDRLKVKLSGDYFTRKDGALDEIFLPKNKIGSISRQEAGHFWLENDAYVKQTSSQMALSLAYDFDSFTLNSLTSYRKATRFGIYDADYGAKETLDKNRGLTSGVDLSAKSWAQELRFNSAADSTIRWVGGIYLENERLRSLGGYDQYKDGAQTWMDEYPSKQNIKTASLFAQGTLPLSHRLNLTLASRLQNIKKELNLKYFGYYTNDGRKNPSYQMDAQDTWRAFLPKVGLEYALNDHLSAYVSYAKGYLAGGFNDYAMGGSIEQNRFEAQTSKDYEAGLKGAWRDFRFSAATFYMDIEKTHVFYTNPKNPNDYRTANADSSESYGVEFEGAFLMPLGLSLDFNANILQTKYGEYINQDGTNNKGNKIEKNPQYKLGAGVSYYAPHGVYGRMDANLIGTTYFDPSNALSQGGFWLADVKVGYLREDFDFYIYAKNITDREYFSHIRDRRQNALVTYGKGRSVGIGLSYSF